MHKSHALRPRPRRAIPPRSARATHSAHSIVLQTSFHSPVSPPPSQSVLARRAPHREVSKPSITGHLGPVHLVPYHPSQQGIWYHLVVSLASLCFTARLISSIFSTSYNSPHHVLRLS